MERRPQGGPLMVGLASLKGGVGKTTSAIHLAAALSARGLDTVLLDADQRRLATAWAADRRLPFRVSSAVGLVRLAPYDVLVVDSRGGAQELLELADSSDLVVLPTSHDLAALDGVAQAVELLADGGIESTRYAALLTRIRPGRQADDARSGLRGLGVPVFAAQIRESASFQEAADQGVIVTEVGNTVTAAACWADYQAVATEVLEHVGRPSAEAGTAPA